MTLLDRVPNVPGSGVLKAVVSTAEWAVGWNGRDVWERPGRLHIETHGVHGDGGDQVARRVERVLEEHPGVQWARVNAPACRVVIGLADPPPPRKALVGLVEQAEAAPSSPEEEVAEDEFHHPAESRRRTSLLPYLAIDLAELGLAGITRVAPWAPLPTDVGGLITAVRLHPRLRELAAQRLHGLERAESVLSVTAGLTQALAGRGFGVVVDIAQRLSQWREAGAERRAWREAEPGLIRSPDDAGADPVPSDRPRPLPDGPVERYQHRVLTAAAIAVPATIPLVGLRRAVAGGLAALPAATETGRAAYASQLGTVLARRGCLVMDRAVLRKLDRLDTLVLDEAVLWSDRWELIDLVPLPGTEPGEAAERGFTMFTPQTPELVQQDGEWTLGPVERLTIRGRTGTRERQQLTSGDGSTLVLGLARGRQLEALFAAQPAPATGLDTVAGAARRAGLRVTLATDRAQPGPGIVDGIPLARGSVRDVVRQRQSEGGGVLLISRDRRALGAADCGIGVRVDGAPPPWGAHVLVGPGLEKAALLVEGVAAARLVARDSMTLAQVASGIGLVRAFTADGPAAAGRSLGAVNVGAALAFADGVWRARHLPSRAAVRTGNRAPWHLMPPETVLRRLATDRAGLSEVEAQRRWRASPRFDQPETTLGAAFLEELANPLTPVLAGGAALSAVVGSLVDAGLVAGVTGVSALAGAVQRVRTDRAMAELFARAAIGVTVRRDGNEQVITADQLVSGDVVRLGPGDVVPADCRLLETDGVEVDESSLTGESLPVDKDPVPVVAAELAERRSMLYEGTTLTNGHALAVVVATGTDTEVGRSMAAAEEAAPRTGVQVQLARMTRRSLPLAAGSAAAVIGAGLLHGVPPRQSLGAAVSLAVGSVPEGLPFLVNAAQLAAARRLAKLGALVRDPTVIEALGRADVLCFDKTGTLTEGRLTVREVHDGRHAQEVQQPLPEPHRAVIAAALRATPAGDGSEELLHQTDQAVVECAQVTQLSPSYGEPGWQRLQSLPFESSRGFHATLGHSDGSQLVSVKGGPEVVLSRCRWQWRDGESHPLAESDLATLTEVAERLAGSGHRVLAVAERRAAGGGRDPQATEPPDEDAVRELVFVGFLALADPVRTSAAPAVARLREAGVQSVMITGDHPATAEAIAATVLPELPPGRVMTGAEIDELDDAALDQRLPDLAVVARCSPAQKVRIVQAYQRLGKVVAMTGDGANDAAAIRLAEVGMALGQRGTPAAQAAADLVVSDDRLETIIAALLEGRAMWASVRQSLAILLGGNLGEIAFTVLAAGATGRSPLNARQLLLVNLFTDLAPALAIALRPPASHDRETLLREGPDRSLGKALEHETQARAVATAAGAGGAWLAARLTGRSRRAATVALAALVGAQLGQTLLLGGTDRNVLLASLGSAAVLSGVIQTPGVSGFFGCTPLGPVGWSIAAGGATAGSLLGAALVHAPFTIPMGLVKPQD